MPRRPTRFRSRRSAIALSSAGRRFAHHASKRSSRAQVMAAQFIINEFMAANGSGLVDGFGERSDWIEIRNIGDTAGDSADII